MADTCIFNLVDDSRGSFSTSVATGYLDGPSRAFHADFAGDYDFLVLLYPGAAAGPSYREIFTPACPGLGITTAVDNRAIYGGTERLTGLFSAPLDMTPGAPPPCIHAGFLRNWGVYLEGVNRATSFASWGAASANGVRGGFDVTTLQDADGKPIADPTKVAPGSVVTMARFSALWDPGKPYSPIELWLMGLIGKEAVPPLYSLIQPGMFLTGSSPRSVFACQGIRKITVDEILAANPGGPPPATRTDFRTAFVLVTPTPAAPDVLAKAEHYARVVGGLEQDEPAPGQVRLLSFAEATGGRATMDVRLTGQPAAVQRLEVHPNKRFVTATVDPVTFEGWRTGAYNQSSATVSRVTRPIYQQFKDDFDFIAFVLDIDQVPEGQPSGQHCPVSNDVQGIGKSAWNSANAYASAGKLKGHFTLWNRTFMEDGPFLHEFMHQYANSLFTTQRIESGEAVDETGHWGFSGCGGQLGGFDQSTLQANVDGIAGKYKASMPGRQSFSGIANGGNSVPFSNLELYLMGMIPEAELTPFDVFSGLAIDAADGDPDEGTWNGKFRATSRVRYTREKIVADFGPRVPSCLHAQKDFKLLVVVLTTAASLPQATADMVDGMITRMGQQGNDGKHTYNFWEATGGRGTMTFDVSHSLK